MESLLPKESLDTLPWYGDESAFLTTELFFDDILIQDSINNTSTSIFESTFKNSITSTPFLVHKDSYASSETSSSSSSSSSCGKTPRSKNYFVNKQGKLIRGKPCSHESGCQKRAQSGGLCKKHGGGRRCLNPSCRKSSQGGGYCRTHGGGKRCKVPNCTKGQQRLGLCYAHGGIRMCVVPGCIKKDRGNGYCISCSK